VARRLRGFEVEGRRPPRAGQAVLADGVPVGELTSGNFAPTLGRGIGLGFVPPDLPEAVDLAIDVRGTAVPARIVPTPFYRAERR